MYDPWEHSGTCRDLPKPDDVVGRNRYDCPGSSHVCIHIADLIRKQKHFVSRIVCDHRALEGLVVCCEDCEKSFAGIGIDERWLVCSRCERELSTESGWPSIQAVAPFKEEPFEHWYERVKDAIPWIPEEVAREWIHRHWGQTPYDYLDLTPLKFEKVIWSVPELLEVRCGERGEEEQYYRFVEIEGEWLWDFMRDSTTWPTPIIVLENRQNWHKQLHDVQLLEGHRRYCFFRQLLERGTANRQHEVWLATPILLS